MMVMRSVRSHQCEHHRLECTVQLLHAYVLHSEKAVSGRQHACVCRGECALTSVKTELDAALFHALIRLWCYGSKGE